MLTGRAALDFLNHIFTRRFRPFGKTYYNWDLYELIKDEIKLENEERCHVGTVLEQLGSVKGHPPKPVKGTEVTRYTSRSNSDTSGM